MEEKRIIIGDFEYSIKDERTVRIEAYVGQTGPGSIAVLRENVVVEGQEKRLSNSYTDFLVSQLVEKLVYSGGYRMPIKDMPILREVEAESDNLDELIIKNCPALQSVVLKSMINDPVKIEGTSGPVRIEYRKGVKNYENYGEELKLTGDNLHVIIGDEVEEVGIIRGGHITLGKGVKEVKALKKADFGLSADTTVAEYELPTRIDFLSAEPPVVGSLAPGSISVTELHVPAGALDAYMNHPQWGKAAFFVEEGGKTVDKYASKHKARLKKLQKDRDDAQAKAAEQAKKDKVAAMGGMMHSTIAPQRLAKWDPKVGSDWGGKIEFRVTIGSLVIEISVPKDSPIDIWDKIVAKLESIEAAQK